MCKKYKACTHALTPRYVTIVRGQFAGMRARPLGRSNSAWGGVALSGSTVVQTSCCRLPRGSGQHSVSGTGPPTI